MNMNKYSRLFKNSTLLVLLLLLAAPLTLLAADRDISDTVIQNHNADASVVPGMIVGFKGRDRSVIVPLASKNSRDMLGVVVPVNNATFTLTRQSNSPSQVLVATSGNYQVLVSNQNGTIKTGDYLTMSAMPGIAMKVTQYQESVIGTATADFDGSKGVIETVPLKGAPSKTKVAIGNITASVRLAPNPKYIRNNSLPGIITRTANQ